MKNQENEQRSQTTEYRLRDYDSNDLPWLKGIEKRSFRIPWSASEWDNELAQVTRLPRVAVDSRNIPIAFAIGTDYPEEEESKLYSLAVDRKHRAKGIGRHLLKDFIERSGENRVALDVLASNSRARKLYRSEGFRKSHDIQEENRKALIRLIRNAKNLHENR